MSEPEARSRAVMLARDFLTSGVILVALFWTGGCIGSDWEPMGERLHARGVVDGEAVPPWFAEAFARSLLRALKENTATALGPRQQADLQVFGMPLTVMQELAPVLDRVFCEQADVPTLPARQEALVQGIRELVGGQAGARLRLVLVVSRFPEDWYPPDSVVQPGYAWHTQAEPLQGSRGSGTRRDALASGAEAVQREEQRRDPGAPEEGELENALGACQLVFGWDALRRGEEHATADGVLLFGVPGPGGLRARAVVLELDWRGDRAEISNFHLLNGGDGRP